ncbi:hypothetical protein GCK32_008047 [Trichostrongylus colubriformis]|uniref:Uncharacterized protein n=1 Tax=Trichostrongylus colubriformis TaxID=6319 RepID=A0AAN8IX82_TRICO
MFDDRGPPPPHIRSRPLASARQLSQRPCDFRKSGSESYSHQRSTQISNSTSRSRYPPLHNSRTYYNSAINDRSHVRIGWTIGGNNMADLYSTPAPPGYSSWSDRISTLTSSSFSSELPIYLLFKRFGFV